MKEILITNDDGFEARGLLELASALREVANVTIVAPSSEKSACSHSLTLRLDLSSSTTDFSNSTTLRPQTACIWRSARCITANPIW